MNKLVQWLGMGMGLVALLLSIYALCNQKKAAYVRSQDLIYKYQGMVDAKAAFDGKREGWQANIDTLTVNFDNNVDWLRSNHQQLTEEEIKEKQQFLKKQQEDIRTYTQQMQQKAEEEETQLLQGVLNQVNAFAEEYGKREGYDLIFGTTLSGSILYGNNTIDITDELLKELNAQYIGRGDEK
jgi:outer membrane protein